MVLHIPDQPNLSLMWLETLRQVDAAGGRVANVLSSTSGPTVEDSGIRTVVDKWVYPGARPGLALHSVDTVAGTIFPPSRYRSPGYAWSPDLTEEQVRVLDERAERLYARHIASLPTLMRFDGNSRGTYFSRMVKWPGRLAGDVNQLKERVDALRSKNKLGWTAANFNDIVVGGEADDPDYEISDEVRGLQILQPTDRRERGFPCLVHIDLTVLDGTLHMLAVYRHQLLITKGYGNILGLGRLQQFIAEQTGYRLGELAIQATLADAEYKGWGQHRVTTLLREATAAA